MRFCEKLNSYMKKMNCTAKALSRASGISESTLSRYRAGSRVPDSRSDVAGHLAKALAQMGEYDEASILKEFLSCEDMDCADHDILRNHLNALIASLNLNLTQLGRSIGYEPSALYRIRQGSRTPSDPMHFAADAARYITRETDGEGQIQILGGLLSVSPESIRDPAVRFQEIHRYLSGMTGKENNPASSFLGKLDQFDLNEYIQALHFDSADIQEFFQVRNMGNTRPETDRDYSADELPLCRVYTGIRQMMDAELHFLKAVLMSGSKQELILYSDMPMGEMAKDQVFSKRWMAGMALVLKSRLRICQIHNLDRSFGDMMLGLESWIPMYMTGQVEPYYLKDVQNNVFLHLLKVSGEAALCGQAIAEHHGEGRYVLYQSEADVDWCRRQAEALLSFASPLIEIYRADRKGEFLRFLQDVVSQRPQKLRSVRCTLPLYTMYPETLLQILTRCRISEGDTAQILSYADRCRAAAEHLLESCVLEAEISPLTEEQFAAWPVCLPLSGMFCELQVQCTYEEYLLHLQQTREYAAKKENFILTLTEGQTFRSLDIFLKEGEWAMVSKEKTPAIHFVIRHPKLCSAIENFVPPVIDAGSENTGKRQETRFR